MTWDSFGTSHFLTLALAIAVNVLIYLILKRNTRTKQILALFTFSLISAGLLAYQIIASKEEILKNLPLSFWALNIIILPFAVLTRERKLCNLSLIWSAGSILALLFDTSMQNVEIISFEFAIFFTIHLLGAGIPLILFELGLVQRDTRTVKSTLIATFTAYTIVHWINLGINAANSWSANEGVNYMSTLVPSSGLLNFFYALFPFSYWYMALVLPLLLVYVLYWYLPEILDNRRRKHALREKLKGIDEYYDEYEEEFIEDFIDRKYK